MIGYMGNSFLPARAGEVLRSMAISRNFGLSTSFTLATALTERIMDVIALVLFSCISLLSLNLLTGTFSSALIRVTLLALAGLVIVLCSPLLEKYFLRFLHYIPLPKNWIEKLSEQLSLFLQGMRTLQNGKRMTAFLAFTVIIWLFDSLIVILYTNIVSSVLSIPQALVLLSTLGLSSAIPSTPGYVGVYQFAAITVLVPFGFSKSIAIAFIIICQIANYLMVGFWGLLGLWILNRNKK